MADTITLGGAPRLRRHHHGQSRTPLYRIWGLTLSQRYYVYGWTAEQTLTTPLLRRRRSVG